MSTPTWKVPSPGMEPDAFGAAGAAVTVTVFAGGLFVTVEVTVWVEVLVTVGPGTMVVLVGPGVAIVMVGTCELFAAPLTSVRVLALLARAAPNTRQTSAVAEYPMMCFFLTVGPAGPPPPDGVVPATSAPGARSPVHCPPSQYLCWPSGCGYQPAGVLMTTPIRTAARSVAPPSFRMLRTPSRRTGTFGPSPL